MGEYVEILTLPYEMARLGTLLRLGTALGYGVDDLSVTTQWTKIVLLVRKDAEVNRPAIVVSSSPPVALDLPPERPTPDHPVESPVEDHPGTDPEPPPPPTPISRAPRGTGVATRTCSMCPRVLETRTAREVHERIDHAQGSGVACPRCGGVYSNQRGMKKHLSTACAEAKPPPPAGPTLAPIERRPFDPDGARKAAADAV